MTVEPVDAADELDVAGAPGRVAAHRLHVLLDRQPRRGSSHDSGRCTMRDGTSICSMSGSVFSAAMSVFSRLPARQDARVVVDLQRADAGREIEDAVQSPGVDSALQMFHQRVHAEAQLEIEHERPVLDQQILVARLAIDDPNLADGSAEME